jgi:hypothetical protein
MKVLTLTQPWASLIETGAKQIETRSWYTAYRGPLLIHAAKGFPKWAKETAKEDEFRDGLLGLMPHQLPTAAIICRCELVACVRTEDVDKLRAVGIIPRGQELKFGDYSEGRFAWGMRFVERFTEPIPAKGALGLWEFQY